MLQGTINKHVDHEIAGLAKRFPKGYCKSFWPNYKFKGLRFYIFFRFGFNNEIKKESTIEGVDGLYPSRMINPSEVCIWYANPEDKEKASNSVPNIKPGV